MPKIICTVTNDLNYDQRMIRICTSLQKAGFEVILVGRKRKNSQEINPQIFQQKRLNCFFQKGKFFYLEYNLRLFFWLLFQKFDIVNSIDLDTILPCFLVSKIRKKICVYDAHEYFTEVPELVERPKIQRIWKRIADFTIPKLTYCYTVCESLAEIFKEKYSTDFEVVRNVPFKILKEKEINDQIREDSLSSGEFPSSPDFQTSKSQAATEIRRLTGTDSKAFRDNRYPDNKIILYQGVLNEGRGIEQTIEAMQFIENAKLWLAGEGDLSEELRKLVIDLKLENKVKFWGYVLPDDLKKITQQCHFGINLLKNKGLNYYYSLANKAFDYIQAEKPSVNMNFPEYQKINQRFEPFLLIDNLETETIKNAFQKLLNDEDLYQKLKGNCKKASQIFIWEEEEKKLIQFYKSIKKIK